MNYLTLDWWALYHIANTKSIELRQVTIQTLGLESSDLCVTRARRIRLANVVKNRHKSPRIDQ